MGYNAFVLCNCYKEGKTSNPPYKEFVKTSDEGLYLDLENLYQKDKNEYFKRNDAFDKWMENACPHEDMKIVDERLANISGMSAFWSILEKLGGESKFPVLFNNLPTSNCGSLSINYSQTFLQELLVLEQEKKKEEKLFLSVKETREVKQSVNINKRKVFIWQGYEQLYGIDKEGFFISKKGFDNKSTKVVFRSKDFRQVYLGNDQYQFVDNFTKKKFIGTSKIHSDGKVKPKKVFSFIVEKKGVTIKQEYAYIIAPLKKLMSASIETGNPVMWS